MAILGLVSGFYRMLSAEDKRNLRLLGGVYFLILSSYSFFRSAATALYLQTYGAKETPFVMCLTAFGLFPTVAALNRLHKNNCAQNIFGLTAILSSMIFMGCFEALGKGIAVSAHVLFIWKEIYIVILVHLFWGYLNNFLKESTAKIFFGFVAATGSVGGILGGLALTPLTRHWGLGSVFAAGVLQLLLAAVIFFTTTRLPEEKCDMPHTRSPIAALAGTKNYVYFIAAFIILAQFCITIAEFKFNLCLEKTFPDVGQKAKQLGLIFSSINALALALKLMIAPILFALVPNKRIRAFIPLFYMMLVGMGFGAGSQIFLSIAASFVFFKGVDYSIFTISKELLYYPLTAEQKYGAKYLTDMLAYRCAKAVMAFALIFIQYPPVLDALMVSLLAIWTWVAIRMPSPKSCDLSPRDVLARVG